MIHYDILDKRRMDILPFLATFKEQFYLAGGTGLALQLGHRDSVDFDFFTPEHFDTGQLFERLLDVLSEYAVTKVQNEKNTLTVVIDDNIKASFMTYKYKLLEKPLEEPFLHIASVRDIGCMKLSAITGRATNKDYIDLFFILKNISLRDLLNDVQKKLPQLDRNIILKSLVYFDDVSDEFILYKEGNEVSFDQVKQFLVTEVRKVML